MTQITDKAKKALAELKKQQELEKTQPEPQLLIASAESEQVQETSQQPQTVQETELQPQPNSESPKRQSESGQKQETELLTSLQPQPNSESPKQAQPALALAEGMSVPPEVEQRAQLQPVPALAEVVSAQLQPVPALAEVVSVQPAQEPVQAAQKKSQNLSTKEQQEKAAEQEKEETDVFWGKLLEEDKQKKLKNLKRHYDEGKQKKKGTKPKKIKIEDVDIIDQPPPPAEKKRSRTPPSTPKPRPYRYARQLISANKKIQENQQKIVQRTPRSNSQQKVEADTAERLTQQAEEAQENERRKQAEEGQNKQQPEQQLANLLLPKRKKASTNTQPLLAVKRQSKSLAPQAKEISRKNEAAKILLEREAKEAERLERMKKEAERLERMEQRKLQKQKAQEAQEAQEAARKQEEARNQKLQKQKAQEEARKRAAEETLKQKLQTCNVDNLINAIGPLYAKQLKEADNKDSFKKALKEIYKCIYKIYFDTLKQHVDTVANDAKISGNQHIQLELLRSSFNTLKDQINFQTILRSQKIYDNLDNLIQKKPNVKPHKFEVKSVLKSSAEEAFDLSDLNGYKAELKTAAPQTRGKKVSEIKGDDFKKLIIDNLIDIEGNFLPDMYRGVKLPIIFTDYNIKKK